MLALLTLLFALAFWAGSHVAWLLAIIIGFNLFFSPLVPLTDALANTAKADHHGLWPGAAMGLYCLCDWFGADRQAGEPVRLPGDPADAKLGVASMLLGMLLKPSVMPGSRASSRGPEWRLADAGAPKLALSRLVLQGAHAAYYGFSAIYWQQAGYSASAVGYLWSLGVVAEVVIFALSKRCSAASAPATCCCSPPSAG